MGANRGVPPGRSAPRVVGDALPTVKDLHHIGGVLHFHVATHVAVGHAVVVLVGPQINVADLLDFGPLIVAQLVRARRQRIQGGLFNLQELLATRGGPVVEAVVVIRAQQLANGAIEFGQAKEGLVGQRIIDALVDQPDSPFDQGFILWMIRARRIDHASIMQGQIFERFC